MNRVDAVWAVGRVTIQPLTKLLAPLRNYGAERIPLEGGVVLAMNHFSWLDPPAFGTCCPRTIHFLAKSEIHSHFGLGQLIRAFGTRSVRRGESDREAVRAMREIVREGHALGLFVEGTRQKTNVPGEAMPGAGMVALQESVRVVPAAIYGSFEWRPWNHHPVSIVWGEPMTFEDIPRSGRGYREASMLIQEEIHRLWRWLGEIHEQGRPKTVTLP
ncbi:MAG TPA: lysophospholipid acyltransferase family protein [Gaiellaceae bacterium]|jgi:1-acyl-sn-glycerol-3-phosphate acyltransferase